MSDQHINTSLERFVPKTPEDQAQLTRMASAVYHQTGSLMLFSWQNIGWADRKLVEQIGDKLYGRRAVG